MEELEEKIQKLESEVSALKDATRIGQTPAMGIAMFVGFILFVILMANIPLPGRQGFWPRFGLGFASLAAGGMICAIALGIVESALKVIVEIAAVILIFINVSVGPIVTANIGYLRELLVDLGVNPSGNLTLLVFIFSAIGLLLFDLFVYFTLYPFAKIAGTKLDPP